MQAIRSSTLGQVRSVGELELARAILARATATSLISTNQNSAHQPAQHLGQAAGSVMSLGPIGSGGLELLIQPLASARLASFLLL